MNTFHNICLEMFIKLAGKMTICVPSGNARPLIDFLSLFINLQKKKSAYFLCTRGRDLFYIYSHKLGSCLFSSFLSPALCCSLPPPLGVDCLSVKQEPAAVFTTCTESLSHVDAIGRVSAAGSLLCFCNILSLIFCLFDSYAQRESHSLNKPRF